MTQLIQQYQKIKAKYSDAILLFRVDDYFESYNEDAKAVAETLGITLTANTKNDSSKVSASLPFHYLDQALQKLVRRGYKVAICEELEGPKTARGLPNRGVTDFN
jgi:DNA mismatch repair protein MutS